jgi:hypothetical protein
MNELSTTPHKLNFSGDDDEEGLKIETYTQRKKKISGGFELLLKKVECEELSKADQVRAEVTTNSNSTQLRPSGDDFDKN